MKKTSPLSLSKNLLLNFKCVCKPLTLQVCVEMEQKDSLEETALSFSWWQVKTLRNGGVPFKDFVFRIQLRSLLSHLRHLFLISLYKVNNLTKDLKTVFLTSKISTDSRCFSFLHVTNSNSEISCLLDVHVILMFYIPLFQESPLLSLHPFSH